MVWYKRTKEGYKSVLFFRKNEMCVLYVYKAYYEYMYAYKQMEGNLIMCLCSYLQWDWGVLSLFHVFEFCKFLAKKGGLQRMR